MTSEPPIEISGSVAGDVVRGNKTVTQTAGGDIVGGDKLTHAGSGHIFAGSGPVVVVQPAASPSTARDRANQLLLLQKVKAFWIAGVLERSVHSAFLIELGRELRVDAIDHPWASVLELPDAASRPLPAGLSDVDAFEQAGRALLILGAPGAGKTITLLEIARDLIARAEADPSQALPVVFNLSNWAIQRADLGTWLVSELAIRYQVPRAVGRAWVTDHRILPLLDGLDEVAPAAQAACVRAVNDYVTRGGLPGLIVCCRTGEYTALPTRLRLNAAIAISPLSPQQIDSYLEAGGDSLAALRQVMQSDDVLAVLAQTPLFLSIMCLAYQGMTPADLDCPDLTTLEQRRRHLLDQYVTRMVKRKGRRADDAPAPVLLNWLSWVARQLKAHNQVAFASERLQPSWLERPLSRWAYVLLSRMGLWMALGVGIGLGLVALVVSTEAAGPALADYLAVTTSSGFVLTQVRFMAARLREFGLVGLAAGLLLGLRLTWVARRQATPEDAAPGLVASVLNIVAATALPALLVIVIGFVSRPPVGVNPADVLVFRLALWIPATILSILAFRSRESGYSLARDIATVEGLDWSWSNSLKGLVAGFLLGALATNLCVISVVTNLNFMDRLFVGSSLSLPVGTLGGLVGATILGLRGRYAVQVTPPGPWVVRHARNALAAGLLIGLATFLAFAIMALPAFYLSEDWQTTGRLSWRTLILTVGTGLSVALPVGGAAVLYFGGAGLIQRAALRIVLVLERHMRWRLTPLADQAENLVFLRRVGGGYIFIHGLVQDYFASLPGR